ncbi:MAG: nucleoside hydrolase [Coxiellaceae bacterium]|nr:nucleoside hydrolase [Coxiellaceae bacterium]
MKLFKQILTTSLLLLCGQLTANVNDHAVPVIFSTDIATGLIDTHGAIGAMPVDVNLNDYENDAAFTVQDVDDGLTIAMALNLQAQGKVKVLAIIPTYGNASLPAETLVAHKIVRELKKSDTPIVAGAVSQYSQTLQPAPQWSGDKTIISVEMAFALSCKNLGVEKMQSVLQHATKPVTILAIGPLTDVACLLVSYPKIKPQIKRIIMIASQLRGESLNINGRIVNDFNFRMDPTAGAILLRHADGVPITLMPFALTGQTSNKKRHMSFSSDTLKGKDNWLIAAAEKRNYFWRNVFGLDEGPFDQYALMRALYPELFSCEKAKAYVQMCPHPAWSKSYADSAKPYNAPNNPCVDHGTVNGATLSTIPAQLIVTDFNDNGELVRGVMGVDGNVPAFKGSKSVTVQVCKNFKSDRAFERFKQIIYRNTW